MSPSRLNSLFQSFIRINWSNILPGMQGQFDKISASFQDLLGETYDYRSVMHYDSTAFSKNGQNTIETIQPGFTSTIGVAAVDLSEADVKKVELAEVLTRMIFSMFFRSISFTTAKHRSQWKRPLPLQRHASTLHRGR
jgi:hypothetical protein